MYCSYFRYYPLEKRGVSAIQEEVSLSYVVCINKPFPHWIIIPAPQVVQSSFLIIYISTIPERVYRTQRGRHTTGFGHRSTPCIIMIFYHMYAVGVNYCHNIALEIVDIEVVRAIEADHGGMVLRIVEKYEEENGWYFVWCDDKPVFVLGSDIQFN